MTEEAKTCKKCSAVKPFDSFPVERRNNDGHSGSCRECTNVGIRHRSALWRKRHPERSAEMRRKSMKKWRRNNLELARERGREDSRKRYAEQTDRRRVAIKKWQTANPEKWKSICRAKCSRRRAGTIHRTPSWSETKAILVFYANCPEGYEVDHIIPLQGESVSGLHVLGNLQYLLAFENRRKSNAYIGGTP
jgi:hypothetical protein